MALATKTWDYVPGYLSTIVRIDIRMDLKLCANEYSLLLMSHRTVKLRRDVLVKHSTARHYRQYLPDRR